MKMFFTTVDFEHMFWLDYKLFFVGHVFEKYKETRLMITLFIRVSRLLEIRMSKMSTSLHSMENH